MAYYLIAGWILPLITLIIVSIIIGREYARLWPDLTIDRRWSPEGLGVLTMIVTSLLMWATEAYGFFILLPLGFYFLRHRAVLLKESPDPPRRKMLQFSLDLLTVVAAIYASYLIGISILTNFIN